MRILHIITGLGDGGAEAVLYRLCLSDQKNEHRVISLLDLGKYGPLLLNAGIVVHCLNQPKGRISARALFRLRQLIKEYSPNSVRTWMYHANLIGGVVAKFSGVEHIIWGIHHTTLIPGKSSRSSILAAKICAVLSPVIPDKIICCAEKAAEVHEALGYQKSKLVVIPNGYDLTKFQPDVHARNRIRTELGIAPGTVLLGTVGRFDPQKDHANLIRALGSLNKQGRDFRLALVGSGLVFENEALCSQIRMAQLSGKILLLGQRNDIPDIMNALDIHVLPSAYGEAFPNVLSEAMACGTPCVTTDVGDAPVIVGETGWVVQPSNSVAMADALTKAMDLQLNSNEWGILQRRARARIVENYDLKIMVDAYNDLLPITEGC